MRHEADELGEGETMILTLADRNILDEAGGLDDDAPDELENALVVRAPCRPCRVCSPACRVACCNEPPSGRAAMCRRVSDGGWMCMPAVAQRYPAGALASLRTCIWRLTAIALFDAGQQEEFDCVTGSCKVQTTCKHEWHGGC